MIYTEGMLYEREEFRPTHMVYEKGTDGLVWVGDDFGCVHHTTRPDPFLGWVQATRGLHEHEPQGEDSESPEG